MKSEIFSIDFSTEIIKEGRVEVFVPKLKAFTKSRSEYAPSKAPVFYNPAMELNRDIAVLMLQAYQKTLTREISVCEPLTGCGIRGIRFAKEVQGVKNVVINDIDTRSFHLANHNVRINRLDNRVAVKNEDAISLLSRHGAPSKRFDVVDIDPFGSPVLYLDSAIRALHSGGLLALTATDLAPLCGVHPKSCIRKYGGKPLRTEYCHELALRLATGSIAMTAARHEMGIDIVFSQSTDHYIRIYSILNYGAKKADENIRKMGYILHCFKCLHRQTLKNLFTNPTDSIRCSRCNSKLNVAGPLWLGEMVDEKFCLSMENVVQRKPLRHGSKIRRLLWLAKGEAKASVSYYVLDKMCERLNLPVPSVEQVIAEIRRRGFQAVPTHFSTRGIKSDAPVSVIEWAIEKVLA